MIKRLLIVASLLSVPLTAGLASPASAQVPAFAESPCPTLTDSVVRLYSAYFLRAPEDDGYAFWAAGYEDGTWSLDRMSEFFAGSDEFIGRYGGVSDLDFVRLIYANVLQRTPDAEGEQFWASQLASGAVTRGQLMLYFSESEEYVAKTATALPIQGYAGWYVDGSRWSCGEGEGGHDFSLATKYVDVVIYNRGSTDAAVSISVLRSGQWVTAYAQTLTPGGVAYGFNVRYGPEVTAMAVTQTDTITGVIVESPAATRSPRPGWASSHDPAALYASSVALPGS